MSSLYAYQLVKVNIQRTTQTNATHHHRFIYPSDEKSDDVTSSQVPYLRITYQINIGIPLTRFSPDFQPASGLCWRRLLLLLLWVVRGTTLSAQIGQIEHLTIEQGLPSNSVTALLQDRQGFVWIGSAGGLSRYDGYDLKVYKHLPDDPQSLANNAVTTIFEDHAHQLWIGTNGGISRYDPQTEKFTSYRHEPEHPESLSNSTIVSIFEDAAQRMWLLSWNGGLNELDAEKGHFRHYYPDPAFPEKEEMTFSSRPAPVRGQPNRFWMSFLQDSTVLYQFDTETKTFTNYGCVFHKGDYSIVWSIFQDSRGTVWLATSKGLYTLDQTTKKLRSVTENPQVPSILNKASVFDLLEDTAGNIWIATLKAGLFIYNPATGIYTHHPHEEHQPKGLNSDIIQKILQDKSGVVWLGTGESGINLVIPDYVQFQHYKGDGKTPGTLTENIITGFSEDQQGHIWVGLESKGVNQLNRATGRFQSLPIPKSDPTYILPTFAVHEDRSGDLWIAMNDDDMGLYRRSHVDGSYHIYRHDSTDTNSLTNNYVQEIYEDRYGDLWLSTADGLDRFDQKQQIFVHYRHDPNNPNTILDNSVGTILEDRSGAIWVGTRTGLSRLDRRTNTYLHFTYKSQDPQSLSGQDVQAICQDRSGAIWVGMERGLNRLVFASPNIQAASEVTITRYFTQDGLPDDFIKGVLEDEQGRLWISTDQGISVLKNPQHPAGVLPDFKNYSLAHGLQAYRFNKNAAYKSRSGELYFGGRNGFNVINPTNVVYNKLIPPIVISSLEKYDIDHPEWGARAEPGVSTSKEIRLSYKNNIFTIRFAALDFREPAANRYAYQLEGFNNNWIQLGTQRQVTFTNLDPGTYIFRVKGSNSDGVWNETGTELKIIITPPWWKTIWAYLCYIILFIVAIVTLVKARLRYLENRTIELEQAVTKGIAQISTQKELLQVQAEKLQELDRTKSNFYTNMTHEFRTPLTVILGMTDQAENDYPPPVPDTFRQNITMIRRNGQQLLRLTNQLLDLSRLDAGQLPVHLVQDDVVGFIAYLVQSFQSFAATKNVQLHFQPKVSAMQMNFDQEKLQSIVVNLLSNAIKFTPPDGHVYVFTANTEETLTVRIKDTGIGISPEKLPYVFDRFYQVDATSTRREEGSGIGLTLAKELVQLAGGTLSVNSVPGEGSEFVITLPISRAELPGTEAARPVFDFLFPAVGESSSLVPLPTAAEDHHLPLLLIVEDNADVAHYLQVSVMDHYQVIIAKNGQLGIDKAVELVPDLIVSDVMMPEKDGFELCNTLKNDERTSHIPIILLTAKADLASRIKGLSRGADAYLAKPFQKEELLVQLQSLLQLRRRLQARYAPAVLLPANKDAVVQLEDQFLAKVRTLLLQHLADESFGVNEIAAGIHLSPSQLFRKIKALTGQSPTIFLRSLRLQKALELLTDGRLSVAEVAYQVGFSDPAYFSRAFSQEFGFAPSSLRK